MKSIKVVLLSPSAFVLCLVLITECKLIAQSSDSVKTRAVEMKQQAPSGEAIVIGYLQTRDRIVTISRDSEGAVYTVKKKNGKTLAAGLREKDFQVKFPVLHDQVKNGLAGNDASLRGRPMPVIDATR
jgi:hypothetical protein